MKKITVTKKGALRALTSPIWGTWRACRWLAGKGIGKMLIAIIGAFAFGPIGFVVFGAFALWANPFVMVEKIWAFITHKSSPAQDQAHSA